MGLGLLFYLTLHKLEKMMPATIVKVLIDGIPIH
jgi:hypothetical protein